ncbi:MAG: nucleotidyl transferase AbiEii/AbiGii toxin family protein [Candidatus Micrarchaeota archaeon]|nr:nucleotidyl transferase AbiEii/AbiGii toxin family protein [Candidatus Micrarchaeota archaeon]
MNINDLRRKSAKEGIPQAMLEKDYVLSVVLNEISKSKIKNSLVFKGGTAIKKVYFAEARFSEDLDFTVINIDKETIVKELNIIFENKDIGGVKFEGVKGEKTTAGLRASLKFIFLLNQPQRILFDFSFRNNLVLEPVEKEVVDSYLIGKTSVKVLSLEELFAEKIHAAISRTVARDLYDIWFLMRKEVKLDTMLIGKKFSYYDEKFELKMIVVKIDDFRLKWNQDLRQLLKVVPDFDDIKKEILERLGEEVRK